LGLICLTNFGFFNVSQKEGAAVSDKKLEKIEKFREEVAIWCHISMLFPKLNQGGKGHGG
jgi:hypothetical protein